MTAIIKLILGSVCLRLCNAAPSHGAFSWPTRRSSIAQSRETCCHSRCWHERSPELNRHMGLEFCIAIKSRRFDPSGAKTWGERYAVEVEDLMRRGEPYCE